MKTSIFNYFTIMLMLVVATTGCETSVRIISDIDSEINITIMENSSGELQFHFSTAKDYSCCNYPIDLSFKKSSDNIDIKINGVIETGLCLTAIGPATGSVNMGSLENGVYSLTFHNRDKTYSGELYVSSESYKINFASSPDLIFKNMQLNKVPDNSIWLAISYSNEDMLLSFIDDLMNLGVTKKQYHFGFYSFEFPSYSWLYCGFMIDEKGIITYYPDITNLDGVMWGGVKKQSYAFQYLGNETNLEQLVKQYQEELAITVFTAKGKYFHY